MQGKVLTTPNDRPLYHSIKADLEREELLWASPVSSPEIPAIAEPGGDSQAGCGDHSSMAASGEVAAAEEGAEGGAEGGGDQADNGAGGESQDAAKTASADERVQATGAEAEVVEEEVEAAADAEAAASGPGLAAPVHDECGDGASALAAPQIGEAADGSSGGRGGSEAGAAQEGLEDVVGALALSKGEGEGCDEAAAAAAAAAVIAEEDELLLRGKVGGVEWSVCWMLLATAVQSARYDARSRGALRRVCRELGVPWQWLSAAEVLLCSQIVQRALHAAQEAAAAASAAAAEDGKPMSVSKYQRWGYIGGGAVLGGIVFAVSGGLAVPAVIAAGALCGAHVALGAGTITGITAVVSVSFGGYGAGVRS